MPESPQTSRDSLVPVLLVLAVGGALLVAVLAITGPAGLFIVLAISGVLMFAALHYLLWGWWLAKRLRDDPDDADDAKKTD
jgi:hypothetical protein